MCVENGGVQVRTPYLSALFILCCCCFFFLFLGFSPGDKGVVVLPDLNSEYLSPVLVFLSKTVSRHLRTHALDKRSC